MRSINFRDIKQSFNKDYVVLSSTSNVRLGPAEKVQPSHVMVSITGSRLEMIIDTSSNKEEIKRHVALSKPLLEIIQQHQQVRQHDFAELELSLLFPLQSEHNDTLSVALVHGTDWKALCN